MNMQSIGSEVSTKDIVLWQEKIFKELSSVFPLIKQFTKEVVFCNYNTTVQNFLNALKTHEDNLHIKFLYAVLKSESQKLANVRGTGEVCKDTEKILKKLLFNPLSVPKEPPLSWVSDDGDDRF